MITTLLILLLLCAGAIFMHAAILAKHSTQIAHLQKVQLQILQMMQSKTLAEIEFIERQNELLRKERDELREETA